MPKIVNVEELTDFQSPTSSWSRYDGYRVELDDDTEVLILISNSQSCCESWGYLVSEENPARYIGAELLDIEGTDVNRQRVEFTKGWDYKLDAISLDDGDVMFVDLRTDKGVLQFAVYNGHNGYYGHDAVVIRRTIPRPSYELLMERGL